jgi:hypothetical protein
MTESSARNPALRRATRDALANRSFAVSRRRPAPRSLVSLIVASKIPWFASRPVVNRFTHLERLILLKTPLTERYTYRKGRASRFLV